jgi:hypothetical protein
MLDGAPIELELESYLNRSTGERLLIVNIESVPAIQALDEILAVPGLDAVLIGPHDLSCSLGVPERYDHPEFLRVRSHLSQGTRGWCRRGNSLLGRGRPASSLSPDGREPADPQRGHPAVPETSVVGIRIDQTNRRIASGK